MKRLTSIALLALLLSVLIRREVYSAVQPISVVSQLTHSFNPNVTFSLNLPLTGTHAIEPRWGSPQGSYNIVFTFPNSVTASSASVTGIATVGNFTTSPDGTQVTVSLTGVVSGQTIVVTLTVHDAFQNSADVRAPMSVLIGDVNFDTVVNVGDTILVYNQIGQVLSTTNFFCDLNVDGQINIGDRTLAGDQSGSALPFTNFTFTLDSTYQTSAGVYDSNNTLVRTLWRGENLGPGAITRVWDGNVDDGTPATVGGTYQIKIVYHNVQYLWDGVLGNTSSSTSGLHVHNGSTFMQSLAIDGTNAFYAIGEDEGFDDVHSFSTSSPQSPTVVIPANSLVGFDLVATDGTLVYSANAASSFAAQYGIPFTTFVVANHVSDNSSYTFPSGQQVQLTSDPANWYSSCIDVDQYSPSPTPIPDARVNPRRPTGIAVQKSGTYLAVAHGGLNKVRLFNKTTGASAGADISVTNPQGMAFDASGNLLVISGASVKKLSVPGGMLQSTISAQLVNPIAVTADPATNLVLVADGGTSQQVKAYNETTGAFLWSYGDLGGYTTGKPAVTNSKFEFQVGPKSDPVYHIALALMADHSFWIGDGATERLLHINSTHNAAIAADTIMFLTRNGTCASDPNNPTRVIGDDWLEFAVDYTKPFPQSWTLVNNWAAGFTPSSRFLSPAGGQSSVSGFQRVITLNGRVYGVVTDEADLSHTPSRRVVVELPSGNVPFRICQTSTGGELDLNPITQAPDYLGNDDQGIPSLEADGTLRYQQISNTNGPTVNWYQQAVSYDANHNPSWGAPSLIASTAYKTSDPANILSEPASFPITTGPVRVLASLDRDPSKLALPDIHTQVTSTGLHLGGIALGASQWRWKASPAVQGDVPFDGMGSFDLFDGIGGIHADAVMAVGRNIVYQFNGEDWNQSEASQWMHFYDDGLFIGQFGTSGDSQHTDGSVVDGFTGGGYLFPSILGVTGNAADPNGDVYIWTNDQSSHSGAARWHVLGTNTIREQSGFTTIRTPLVIPSPTPAPFASALKATPGNQSVVLSWSAASGGGAYSIKRATVSGGPYTVIAKVSSTTYTATSLTNGIPYYFVVSAAGNTANSNQVEAWPFATVGTAGTLVGGQPFPGQPAQVSSSAVAQGLPALTGLSTVVGNLSRTNVGSNGYVLYDSSVSGNVNLRSPFTVTKGAGWSSSLQILIRNQFSLNNVVGPQSSLVLDPTASSASITVNSGGSPGVHYLTVYVPADGDLQSFTLGLAPLGGGTAVTYITSKPLNWGNLEIYQFEFTGNVVLTMTNSGGHTDSCVIQGLFID